MKLGKWLRQGALICGMAGAMTLSAGAQMQVDKNLPKYQPVKGISGSLKSVGSDTMANLMTLWLEGFKKIYPNVTFGIEAKGSGTAPQALIEGTANFGPMSRNLKQEEVDAFEKKFGYPPIQLGTALDVVGVYVNKDNPIKGLSMKSLDAILSKNRLRGASSDITTWGQAGLTGDWANLPISIYGRNSASGTYAFVKEHVMNKGDFKDSVKEQPGSSAVVQGVASDKAGIGYSGIGYKTADVRAIPLAMEDGGQYFEADAENAYSGDYPLSRFLYLAVNYKPNSQLDPLRKEFLKYVFSQEGQEAVMKEGFYPISAAVAKQMLEQAGIKTK